MAGKTGAEKGLEEIKAMRTRARAEKPEMSMLSGEEKNEASVLIENLTAEEKAEIVHLTGGDYNTMTPLLVREYLWRKKNRRKLKGLSDDIREAEYRVFRTVTDNGKPYSSGTAPISHGIPAAEATLSGKGRKETSHGRKAGSTISPVISEYLMARAAGKSQDSAYDEKGTASSCRSSQAATLEIPPSRHERIDLEELSEMRIPAGKADPMAIMNANYEYDRAVLAKTDPMFARNLFHDVGHADGSGEMLDKRTANKIIMSKCDEEISKIMEAK